MSSQPAPGSGSGGSDQSPSSRGPSSSGNNNNNNNNSAGKQTGQPLKRACDQCNLRRVKCSHEHPCAHCVRLRINCTYWKAARGKESSGKRIEKLRREQALAAAAAASHGPPAPNIPPVSAVYPLSSFHTDHHQQQQQHTPYVGGQPKVEDGNGGVGVGGVGHPLPPPSAQYAGPSAHFPTNNVDQSPHAHHRQHSTSSSHPGSSNPQTSQAGFPRPPAEGYVHPSTDPTHQNNQAQQGGQQTHVPPAVFLGNAFFPPSLTTISPSTAANFRLPDLSTSLADEFNAQDPNVRANNFFDWGMGMLGGGAQGQPQQQQQQQQQGAQNNRNLSMDSSLAGGGLAPSPADSFGGPSAGPPGSNTPSGPSGAGLGGLPPPPPQASAGVGQNARMNVYDWGLGMTAGGLGGPGPGPGPLDASGLSPHPSTSTSSETNSPNAAAAAAAAAHASGGGSRMGVGLNGAGAVRSRAISFHGNVGDYAIGLQQQQQQRFIQEQQIRQQQQQAAAAAASGMHGGMPMGAANHGAMGGDPSAGPSIPPPTIPPQGLALPPSMQGVLPSTLEILSGSHPLSESVLLPHIGLYFERLHPIMPVFSRSWIFSKLDRGHQHTEVDFASMLLAMSALALIQPQEAKERASARMRVKKARALLEESVRLRNAVLFGRNPTLEATMTSFYVFACLFGLGEDNPAWFRLHEAVALGLLLKLHEPKAYADLQRDEQERRLRAYWLLVITERAYSLQRGHSLGFRGHPEKTTRTLRHQFGLEELEDFPHLQLKLFDAVDEDFVDCWNGRCEAAVGERCSRMDGGKALKLWATFQQSEREINDEVLAAEVAAASKKQGGGGVKPLTEAQGQGGESSTSATAAAAAAARARPSMSRSEDERQAEFERHKIQLADHRITAQWLLNRLWNLCLTHGHVDLSPSSLNVPSTSSSSSNVPAPFRLDAALRIARKMLAICHELDQAAMEAHGIGLMEKLYDVAMTLVLICRDYPALAKRIGLVDLNLKRGVNGGGGGGVVGVASAGGRRRVEREGSGEGGKGYEVVVDGEEEEEEEDGEGYHSDEGRPAALSPSVPGFSYPLEDGSGPGNLAHPHLSMGAVMQQIPRGGGGDGSLIAVKREDDQDPTSSQQQGTTTGRPTSRSSRHTTLRPAPRPLRQAPTAIESILQEYVEIFRVFRAGDHPFLEKMVLAMKELAQGLPRSSRMGTPGVGAGGAIIAGLPARAQQQQQQQQAQQQQQSGQSVQFMGAGPSATPVSSIVGKEQERRLLPGAYSTTAPPHPASLSGSGDTNAAAMQRASAYVYTPGSNSGVVDTPSYGSGSGDSSGVATAGGGRSSTTASGMGVLSPTPTNVSSAGSYGGLLLPPQQQAGFQQSYQDQGQGQGQLSPGVGGGVYASPLNGGVGASSPSARMGQLQQEQGQVGGPGMEWAQLPEDLGWPSFESFLRECGLWDSVGQGQAQAQT
ncbi:hypothetical protein CF319_g2089 [Tilletia indica]|nr:hypothetical protein CF319_g2089 [Tilletia indica]